MIKAGDYQPREIAKEKLLYVVISTHGDGDPPDEARGLYEFLGTKRAPQLPELQYSVLALGDTSYPKFCEAGRVIDERLAKLGAKRLLPRVDCDVDFEKLAQTWADDALARVREYKEKHAPAGDVATGVAPAAAPAAAIPELTRANPATAEVLANQRIVGRGALREVRHVEAVVPGPRQSLQGRRCARHRASQSRTGHRRGAESHEARCRRDGDARRQDAHAARVAARRARAHAHRASAAGAGGQARQRGYFRAARQRAGDGQAHRHLPGVRHPGHIPGGMDSRSAGERAAPGHRPRVLHRLQPRGRRRRSASDRRRRGQRYRSQTTRRRRLAFRGQHAGRQRTSRCGSRRTNASVCRPTARAT